ncbi:hypothetical protein GS575_11950 [Rhodococcus hoagii]|nr:hypothetical protein [Prescottella equi]
MAVRVATSEHAEAAGGCDDTEHDVGTLLDRQARARLLGRLATGLAVSAHTCSRPMPSIGKASADFSKIRARRSSSE